MLCDSRACSPKSVLDSALGPSVKLARLCREHSTKPKAPIPPQALSQVQCVVIEGETRASAALLVNKTGQSQLVVSAGHVATITSDRMQHQQLAQNTPGIGSQISQAASYYSIDVECVATGPDHNSRSVAQVAVVVSHIMPDIVAEIIS